MQEQRSHSILKQLIFRTAPVTISESDAAGDSNQNDFQGKQTDLSFWVQITQIFANIAVPLTIVVGIAGLLMQSWTSKAESSRDQVAGFYGAEMMDARATLIGLWIDRDLSSFSRIMSRKAIDALVDRVVATSEIPHAEIDRSVIEIALYFDRVEACIETESCAPEDLISQIGNYARDFQCTYVGRIQRIRARSLTPTLGVGTANFAQRAGGCRPDG